MQDGELFTTLGEIDVSQYREGTIEVLIRNATLAAGSTIIVAAIPMARVPGDSEAYVDGDNPTGLVTLVAQSEQGLLRGAFVPNVGAMVAITIAATGGGTAGALTCEIQVNLSLKN